MVGLDYVLENYSYLDADNMVALGASYGGTAINYINGHTNRFKALVNHDGIFNTVNAYYTTGKYIYMYIINTKECIVTYTDYFYHYHYFYFNRGTLFP